MEYLNIDVDSGHLCLEHIYVDECCDMCVE